MATKRPRYGLVVGSAPQAAALRPLKQPLYDTNIYAAAGQAQLQFFSIPRGQAMPVTGVAKSEADTNMQQASQLGTPNMFELYGFNCKFQQSVWDADDFNAFYDTGVFRFFFGQQRPWLTVPLSKIPCGVMPSGSVTIDGAAAPGQEIYSMTNGPPHTQSYYNFTVRRAPILINSNETFSVTLDWPLGAVAVTANGRITVELVGILHSAL